MLIKKIAFGNHEEAFIEENLKDKINIIFSNDNNKGKTLLIQGLMYSIGNVPIFPSGFDHNNYYFYSMIDVGGVEYEFLRRNKTTIIKNTSEVRITESLSELKYLINNNLFALPVIEHSGEDKLVDLYLFYQLFFIGQDKRNTSNIQNSGQYTKKDFISMLNSLNGSKQSIKDKVDIEFIKKEIKRKESEIRILRRSLKFISENPDISSYSLKSADQEEFEKNKRKINIHNENITKYKKQRAREINKNSKLNNLLSELISLNQNIEIGKIKCGECGSEKIIYANNDMSFDVSNSTVRKNIINSIKDQIKIKDETINELNIYVQEEQDNITKLLREFPPKLRDYIVFSEEILSSEEYSSKIVKINEEIDSLRNDLKEDSFIDDEIKNKNKKMMESILKITNRYYRLIDPDGNLILNKLFTKNEENYSGSEEQEFYFSKLLALNEYFKHEFPIIIDSYRSGELSSMKELEMLKAYKELNKQIILTSTLKTSEYNILQYDSDNELNTIDYSSHKNSKILTESYKDKFIEILNKFNVN